MKKILIIGLLLTGASASAQKTTTFEVAPVSSVPASAQPVGTSVPLALLANTRVKVKFLTEINTEDKSSKVGDRPRLEVAEDVSINGVTVIPMGTPVTGELTAIRNKGMWGKSGKIEGRVLTMSLNGRTIRMSGSFDDKGTTGSAGVVASVALIPVAGFFITGTSARIPSGSIINAFVDEDVFFNTLANNSIEKTAGPITLAEQAALRAALRKKLNDPESARFRWLERKSKDGMTYCGFVNAKNRFGGYVGFAPYLAVVQGAFAEIIEFDSPDTDVKVVREQCAKRGIDLAGPTIDDN